MKTQSPITEFKNQYHFLSNFFDYSIQYKGVTYKSSEHAYQAQKATTSKHIKLIMHASNPGQAKKIARGVDKSKF